MGAKDSKAKGAAANGGKKSKLPDKPTKLTDKDIKYFTTQTGLTKEQINDLLKKFNENNPDGKLDRQEFNKLYPKLRNEPVTNLDEISDFVFRAFDSDGNGYLTFNEFLVGYALTTKGDQKAKLAYAFDLYDADNNGFLTKTELQEVIIGMLDLLGADKKSHDPKKLADECMKELDASNDGKISKDEFVNGLLKNYSLRALMSPFN